LLIKQLFDSIQPKLFFRVKSPVGLFAVLQTSKLYNINVVIIIKNVIINMNL